MIARQIIQRAAQRGWNLTVEGSRIVAEPLPTCTRDMPPELADEIRANRRSIIRHLTPMPPMPKSVRACLDWISRHPDRDLTPKLHAWLDKDWRRIERYERAVSQ